LSQPFIAILIGLAAGILSGCFGIGGGIILVPALVLFLGLTQHQAQGTSLAVLVLPVVALAVWKYYSQGNVNFGLVGWLAAGFVVGGFLGATAIQGVADVNLKKAFALLLIGVGIKMFFGK
jgi:uncharacterized protein